MEVSKLLTIPYMCTIVPTFASYALTLYDSIVKLILASHAHTLHYTRIRIIILHNSSISSLPSPSSRHCSTRTHMRSHISSSHMHALYFNKKR